MSRLPSNYFARKHVLDKMNGRNSPVIREKKQHEVTLVWDDAVSTKALVDELAPEVMCGKYRFLQDPRDKTIYREISQKTRAEK